MDQKAKAPLANVDMEAYALWKEEYPARKIGKSEFAEPHPCFVLLMS